jgi:predicted DNA-binding WGR domain protein
MPAVTVYAWELHKSEGTSDKYYRLVLIENVLLVNYGRRNTRGQFIAHCKATVGQARALARVLTNQKDAKGYQVTRDATSFLTSAQVAQALTGLDEGKHGNPVPDACDELIASFKTAAAAQATASGEASW